MIYNFDDSFKGDKEVILQPLDYNINHGFTVTVKSSITPDPDDEGRIPYGTNVTSVSVSAYKITDEERNPLPNGPILVNDLISNTPTVFENIIYVKLSYPITNGLGYYKITMEITIDNGSRQEIDFKRIFVKDK